VEERLFGAAHRIAINWRFRPGELKLASLNPDFNTAINGRSSTDFMLP